MAYIYVITNKVNGKQYVGKTLLTISERFEQHCRDAQQEQKEQRPFYKAIKKYGIDNFQIDELEYCSNDIANEREIFWINALNTFQEGYNATLGGDGTHYADYALILSLWDEGKTIKEICTITNYDYRTVRRALSDIENIKEAINKRRIQKMKKAVIMLDKNTSKELKIFSCLNDAYDFLDKPNKGHISEVCNNKRKTAYGYKWKWA